VDAWHALPHHEVFEGYLKLFVHVMLVRVVNSMLVCAVNIYLCSKFRARLCESRARLLYKGETFARVQVCRRVACAPSPDCSFPGSLTSTFLVQVRGCVARAPPARVLPGLPEALRVRLVRVVNFMLVRVVNIHSCGKLHARLCSKHLFFCQILK